LLRHGGRPHWGKLHNLQGQALEALYPKWNDFRKLREQLDPEGRMLNLYLKGLFNV
jgi:FAD/FMN-containing dehydrogenase